MPETERSQRRLLPASPRPAPLPASPARPGRAGGPSEPAGYGPLLAAAGRGREGGREEAAPRSASLSRPVPSHGGRLPRSAAGAAPRAGERRSRGGREGPGGGGRRAGIWSSEEECGGVRFLLLKAAANARARQTLPLPLAPPQPAPGIPQPRRALPPGRAASAKKVSIFSSESRARQGPPPAPKPAGCAAPRVGLHVYNARFSSAKQRCAGCATSFRVVETFWGNSSSVFCDL